MSPILYPPLPLIERSLFDPDTAETTDAQGTDPLPADSPEPNLDLAPPPFLSDLIRRRVASQDAFSNRPLAVGQIRRLSGIPATGATAGRQFGRSLAVLLTAHLQDQRWLGWIVAQETDYAASDDLLIEASDGPCDPVAGMIQTWNAVEVLLDGRETCLGEIAPARLAAAFELGLARPAEQEFIPSRPGKIGAWDLRPDLTVVTGTPLGDETDPRHAYRSLYGRVATELQTAARQVRNAPAADTASTGKFDLWHWLTARFSSPVWALGAIALLVVQTLWFNPPWPQLTPETGVYRSSILAGHRTQACAQTLHVIFRPQTDLAEIILLIRKLDATIASGPSETGEFWLSIPADRSINESLAMLKTSRWVETADIRQPATKGCQP